MDYYEKPLHSLHLLSDSTTQGITELAQCTLCGSGKYSIGDGGSRESSCTKCSAGRYSVGEGVSQKRQEPSMCCDLVVHRKGEDNHNVNCIVELAPEGRDSMDSDGDIKNSPLHFDDIRPICHQSVLLVPRAPTIRQKGLAQRLRVFVATREPTMPD